MFPRRTLLPALLTLLLLPAACGPTPRQRTAAVLDDVESYINDRPDSALTVLRGVDTTTLGTRALRARYALLHTMALDKCYIDLQTDSILLPAIAWYMRHGSPNEKLKTLYYQGRIRYNAENYKEAIVLYTKGLEFAGKATDRKYLGLCNQAVADTYSISWLEEEAIPYLNQAYGLFLQTPDESLAKKTLYKKALVLSTLQYWQAADSLFQRILSNPEGIESLIPAIKSNYALHLLRQGGETTNRALELYREALSSASSLPSSNHWAAYAYCLAREGFRDSSKAVFSQLEAQYPQDKRILFWRNRTEYYEGDINAAYQSFQQVVSYQDSLTRIQLRQSTLAAQKVYFENKSIVDSQVAQKRLLFLWLSLAALCLICLLGYLIVSGISHQARQKQFRLMQTIDVVKTQLVLSQQGSIEQERETQYWHTQYYGLFREYFNTLGQICADYEEGKLDKKHSTDRAVLRRIDLVVRNFTGRDENHEEFERVLNKHLDNIMIRFRQDFPHLSRNDYYLASYVFAGIDSSTIGVLMGVEVDALYTRKSRLKSSIVNSSTPNREWYLSFFHR